MTDLDALIQAIQALTARELTELKRRLRDDLPGSAGFPMRLPPTPRRPLPAADAEDRSIKGRTLP